INEKGIPAEFPQVLSLGDFNKATLKWSGGMHLNSTKDTLSFWYKYLPSQPSDNASLMLMMVNNGAPISGNSVFLPASSIYKEMKISVQSSNQPNSFPCDLVLMFNSSITVENTIEHVGTTLFLDHLTILPYKGTIDIIPTSNNPVLDNEGFEIWDSHPFEIPEGYPYSSNLLRIDGTFPYNASKTSLAQHGNFSLRLETDGMVGNNFGFIINEVPSGQNPANWKGGIPISGKPTGLQGYYLFHSTLPDSATIMVFFKKGGLNIGSYYLSLLPASGEWYNFNKTFSPPLTETPDSMIIGIVSSSNTSGAVPTGSILMIDNISFTGIATQPEKLNGDFENWVTTRIETAPGWSVSDQDRPGTHQTTNAAVGTYAMEIKTTARTNEQGQTFVDPMWISNGNWDKTVQNWVGGSPLSNKKDTLAFHYRYMPAVPHDTAQLSMMFKFQGQFIAFNQAFLLPNNAWQYQEVPLLQQQGLDLSSIPCDSVLFYFQSSLWSHNTSSYAGSTLLLDDVHFKSSRYTVGVNTAAVSPKPEIYPNPCQGVSTLRFEGKLPESLDVFNLSGQKILSISKERISAETVLDLTGRAAGLYIVRITGEKRLSYLKLMLK
ncbi:MAG: T9SS type A sorting domain-containing protein, partial [Bacteroidia bacterium]|nr:T9SS type A sorting domain-containing protein [Bacteroidia bacterium]